MTAVRDPKRKNKRENSAKRESFFSREPVFPAGGSLGRVSERGLLVGEKKEKSDRIRKIVSADERKVLLR